MKYDRDRKKKNSAAERQRHRLLREEVPYLRICVDRLEVEVAYLRSLQGNVVSLFSHFVVQYK